MRGGAASHTAIDVSDSIHNGIQASLAELRTHVRPGAMTRTLLNSSRFEVDHRQMLPAREVLNAQLN